MDKKYEVLFTPWTIGNCEIKNRIVMSPMATTTLIGWNFCKGYDDSVHDLMINRCKDGVGLIIPGAVSVKSLLKGKWLNEHPKAFEGLDALMNEIHSYGTKVFPQISAGLGRNFTDMPLLDQHKKLLKPLVDLDKHQASSDEGLPNLWYPEGKNKTKALTVDEIHQIEKSIAETARLFQQHGADGIEVHALHEGYLLDQFAMPYTNHRKDAYGGSRENMCRFATEIVTEIKHLCGKDFPVVLRFSVESKVKDFNHGILPQDDQSVEIGRTAEESEKMIQILREAGYDAFDCDNGTYDSWYWAHPPVYMPLNCNLSMAEHIKQYTDAPIICAGRMELSDAARSISQGKLDAVGIARQFLADECFLTKVKEDRTEDIRPCIACHAGCMPLATYKGAGAVVDFKTLKTMGGCALNPYTKHEKEYAVKPAKHPKKIAVIGGGIAGMEFALQASKRGHTIDLYEKSDHLGGVFIAAAAPSFKEKDRDLLQWYQHQIECSDVSVHLESEIHDLDTLEADEIVIATGSGGARSLRIEGSENAYSATDVLLGKKSVKDKVVIIGGGLTGCELAYELCLERKHPVIIEMADDLIRVAGVCMANSNFLRDAMAYYHVPVYLNAKTKSISNNSVTLEDAEGKTVTADADNTVVSIGYLQGNPFFTEEVKKKKKYPKNVHVIGDADHVANLLNAIHGANELVLKLSD